MAAVSRRLIAAEHCAERDVHDARAIWPAVRQPRVKAVAIKTEEQQAILALHRKAPIIADEASAQALAQYCPDLENWAQSWCYEERDLVPGKRIVEFLRPFLLHLLAQGLTAKTLRKHCDYLWMLGGEVIRRRHENSNLSRVVVEKATFALLEEDGGPLIFEPVLRFSGGMHDGLNAGMHGITPTLQPVAFYNS